MAIEYDQRSQDEQASFVSDSIGADSTGTTIYVHEARRGVTITAIPSGGSIKVQFTTSLLSTVQGGGGTWQDWSTGASASTASDGIVTPVTAVRGVTSGGGTGTLEVVF